ncbi:MAG: hypothetical protein ACW990_00070 [Promethearchaeota archaeon]|jgi:hypothetical protein
MRKNSINKKAKEYWKKYSKLTGISLTMIRAPKYSLLHSWLESYD